MIYKQIQKRLTKIGFETKKHRCKATWIYTAHFIGQNPQYDCCVFGIYYFNELAKRLERLSPFYLPSINKPLVSKNSQKI